MHLHAKTATMEMWGEAVIIEAIRHKSPSQIQSDVNEFAVRYVDDWEAWLATKGIERHDLFGRILRKWQATRPRPMRRLRSEAKHEPPFLDELIEQAAEPIRFLSDITLLNISKRTKQQDNAFGELWSIFSRLSTADVVSCVGITKVVLLLTDGQIGPAFDSKVRGKLGINQPVNCTEWVEALEKVGGDIEAFESTNGPLTYAVPARFAHLGYGRLYDMVLGPR